MRHDRSNQAASIASRGDGDRSTLKIDRATLPPFPGATTAEYNVYEYDTVRVAWFSARSVAVARMVNVPPSVAVAVVV